jgi:ribonuclease E
VAQPAPPAAKTPLADLFGEKPLDVDVFGLGEPPAEHRPRDERRPQVEPRAPGPPPAMLDDDEDEGPVLDYDLDSDLDLDLDSDSEVEEPQKPPPPRSEDRQRSERPSDRPRDEREGGGRRRRRGRGRGRRDEGRRDEGRRDEGRMEEAPRTGHAPPQPRRERDDELPPPPDELDDIFGETIDLDDEEAVDLAQPPTEERARSGQRGERAEREDREEGGGRRRRRRRGRGGRGRTEEGRGAPREAGYAERRESRTPPAPGPETEVEPLDLEDYGEEPPAARDYRQPAPPRAAASDADELDLEPEESDDREGGHAVHKKIPTWDDAVGILIDANMAARANSPDRSRHSRGGRGGRGR